MIDKNIAGKVRKRAAVYFVVTTLIGTRLSVVLRAFIITPQSIDEDMVQIQCMLYWT